MTQNDSIIDTLTLIGALIIAWFGILQALGH